MEEEEWCPASVIVEQVGVVLPSYNHNRSHANLQLYQEV